MASKKLGIKKNIDIRNRRASFEYLLIDKYQAGIVLKGTEIKSVRMGKVNLKDAFCLFIGKELWVRDMHISPYLSGGHSNHAAKTDRKLLLSRKELDKLQIKSQDVGLTIIPTRMYVNDRGFAKVEIALAKGKKLFDKRQSIKEKDLKREVSKIHR